MRAANRAMADKQLETRRAAGFTVKARQAARGDTGNETEDHCGWDDGRER